MNICEVDGCSNPENYASLCKAHSIEKYGAVWCFKGDHLVGISGFGKNKSKFCGIQAYCKDCTNKSFSSWSKGNDSHADYVKNYTASHKEEKRISDKLRYSDPTQKEIYRKRARERYQTIKDSPEFKKAQRSLSQKNLKKNNETKSLWKKRNPDSGRKLCQQRRALKAKRVSDSGLDIATLRERDGDLCFFCGVSMYFGKIERWKMPLDAATHEHLTPITRGGHNTFDNSVLCCYSCNSSKHNKTEVEFYYYLYETGKVSKSCFYVMLGTCISALS